MSKNRMVAFTEKGVEKKFDHYEWYLLEKNAYLMLHKIINSELVSEGWTIKSPDVLDEDYGNKSILLELLPGENIDILIKNKKMIPWFQIGEGLGVFHSRSKADEGFVNLFSDIGIGNILVDGGSKTISFIDPGINFGKKGRALSDLFMVMWAIFSARIRHFRRLNDAENQFWDGWYSYLMHINPSHLNYLDPTSALASVEKTMKERRIKKMPMKKVVSFFVFFIWKIIWIPLYMRKFLMPNHLLQKD